MEPADEHTPRQLRMAAPFGREWGDIYVLSKMLGHSSVQVTQRHDAFIAPDDVGAKVLAVMEPTKPTTTKPTKRKR